MNVLFIGLLVIAAISLISTLFGKPKPTDENEQG